MNVFEERKYDSKNNNDQSLFGAFPGSGLVDFTLIIPKEAILPGSRICSVNMVIHADGWNNGRNEYRSFTMKRVEQPEWLDSVSYTVPMDFAALLKIFSLDGEGLFYYHYAVILSYPDGADIAIYLGGEAPTALSPLKDFVGERQLLLYRDDYATSTSFREGVIYHVFVDRFASSGRYPVKERAVLNPDWDHGVPPYALYPGEALDNNVFFGGDLTGVEEKLDYIAELGVKTIYLSPIFEAYTNHKYDTADYLTVDSMFGGENALRSLCQAAREKDIQVILDGVFNHTGDDSVYFNRYGHYDSVGAYQSKESPYYSWYYFKNHPYEYDSWWGVDILPRLHSDKEEVRRFICSSVVPKWMEAGVGGWRLDVADELSESFLDDFRAAVKEQNRDAVIIGEVWEDASDKVAYGRRRRYFGGRQLDSVMNYPLRSALIEYVKYGATENLRRYTEGSYRRYPKQSSDTLMNFLGSHDTERILTVLGGADCGHRSNAELAEMKMSPEERKTAVERLKLAYGILAGLPGVPCVFYGDEAGLEGYRDPFCRKPFPWKKIDEELVAFYRRMGQIRRDQDVFRDGLFRLLSLTAEHVIYVREPYGASDGASILVAACRTGELHFTLPQGAEPLFGEESATVTLKAGQVGYYRYPGQKKLTAQDLGL